MCGHFRSWGVQPIALPLPFKFTSRCTKTYSRRSTSSLQNSSRFHSYKSKQTHATSIASLESNELRPYDQDRQALHRDLRVHLMMIEDLNADDLNLTLRENRIVDMLILFMTELQSVTKVLQVDSASMLQASDTQNETVAKFSVLRDRLFSIAQFVLNPHFESAVIFIEPKRMRR